MLALRLRQATAGVLVIGILLAFIGFCALLQVCKVTQILIKGLKLRVIICYIFRQ